MNLFYNELVFGGKSRDYLLSLQLRKLQVWCEIGVAEGRLQAAMSTLCSFLQMMFDMYVQSLQSLDSKGVMIGKLFERNRR